MTRARKTGPMMSAMDLIPARAIVKAAAPNRSVSANGRARSWTSGADGGVFSICCSCRRRYDGPAAGHLVMSRPWAVRAQMTKTSRAMIVIDQNG